MRVCAKKIGPSLSWIRCIRQQKALYGWDTWSGRILWLRQLVSVSARGEQQHTEVVIFDGAQVCPVYIIRVKCSAPNHWVIHGFLYAIPTVYAIASIILYVLYFLHAHDTILDLSCTWSGAQAHRLYVYCISSYTVNTSGILFTELRCCVPISIQLMFQVSGFSHISGSTRAHWYAGSSAANVPYLVQAWYPQRFTWINYCTQCSRRKNVRAF